MSNCRITCDGARIRLESSQEILATGERSTDTRYYLSSLTESAEMIERKIRSHWEIESVPQARKLVA